MVENKTDYTGYKMVVDIKDYVQKLIHGGTQIVIGEKTARISARHGIPEEHIISWSVDAEGKPVLEKEAVVSVDDAGIPDWVATKIDDQGNEIVDANGNKNQWIIGDTTFMKKYEAVPEKTGIFKPVGGPQKFIQLNEAIHIVQCGEEWNVDAGGFVNITNPDDMYVISGKDFADTYRII